MRKRFKRLAAALSSLMIGASAAAVPTSSLFTASAIVNNQTGNVLEYLDRGICAVNTGSGMLVSWRWLGNDSDTAVFKLYRDNTLIYTSEGNSSTCYLDKSGSSKSVYRVDTYSGSKLTGSETCKIISNNTYFDVPLTPPTASGVTYSPNDMSVGDVDGDGQYELFLKWDPSNSKDNSQKGKTDKVYIDCLRLDGTRLWRIDLGWNIRAGAHYTQFYVGDFDLDGKAEMTCKTGDGTIDGTGKVIGDGSKTYRDGNGFIYSGPEYYTLFDGATGAALDTINYEPGRGDPTKWGKSSDKTNRVDRFWGTVAYLDGVHPCIVTGRGYYGRMTATAYKVENKKLVKMWMFDTGTSTSAAGYGCGNHNSMPADVDGDGRQEIITGAAVIDDDGKLYYTTGQGHGDAMHVGDLDPTNPGLEAWICHEEKASGYGVSLLDLDQKKIIYHQNGAGDTGRCCADNVWAQNPGAECWGNKLSDNSTPVVDTKGNTLSCRRPAINFLSYWDGDLEREILDGYTDSPATITDMNENGTLSNILTTDGYYTCNTTKGTPCLSADIFGDWREELIVRAANHNSVRIYCTPYATDYRVTTLMHDSQYRMQVSSQNTAYNQPPHTSFFMGTGYDLPARCGYNVNGSAVNIGKPGAEINEAHKYMIRNVNSGLYLEAAEDTVSNGTNVQQGNNESNDIWEVKSAGGGYYYIYHYGADSQQTHLLDVDYGKTENGTNIGIWTDTESDAQLYKFVDNGDGTYTICTKASGDDSCIGVTGASKDSGANVVEWECNDSNDQKWTLEIKVLPFDGSLFKNVLVKDKDNYQSWQISSATKTGSLVFGDRDFTFTSLPDQLSGGESLLTACNSKNASGDLAEFTAGADMNAYVLIDQRNTGELSWLSGFTKTDMTAASSNDVVFDIYQMQLNAGDTVILGNNDMTGNVVNYTVIGKKLPESGKYVKSLTAKDADNGSDWSLRETAETGSAVYGDRDVTYTALPESVSGAEYIETACDSKNVDAELAEFTAGEDIEIYVLIDQRVAAIPEWLNSYTRTGDTAAASNDVVYDVYKKSASSGETVILGTNGQSAGCVSYTVFVKGSEIEPVTETTTLDEENVLYGDANCDGKVTVADAVSILQHIALREKYELTPQGLNNADVNLRGNGVTPQDALSIQKLDANVITSLPESYNN